MLLQFASCAVVSSSIPSCFEREKEWHVPYRFSSSSQTSCSQLLTAKLEAYGLYTFKTIVRSFEDIANLGPRLMHGVPLRSD